MKKILVLTCVLSLSGCYQTTNQWDIEQAVHICGGVEKIVEINVLMTGDELVTCKNGNVFNLNGTKIQ